jgi:hypothetical protein
MKKDIQSVQLPLKPMDGARNSSAFFSRFLNLPFGERKIFISSYEKNSTMKYPTLPVPLMQAWMWYMLNKH